MVSYPSTDLLIAILMKYTFDWPKPVYVNRRNLLRAYNDRAQKKVSTRSVDRYIKELNQAGLLNRWPRKKNVGKFGNCYVSAGHEITEKGMEFLKDWAIKWSVTW